MERIINRLLGRGAPPKEAANNTTYTGPQGASGAAPDVKVRLLHPCNEVLASCSGPDGGVQQLQDLAPDLKVAWDRPTSWAYGASNSTYDSNSNGTRNGDPIADCFGVLAYREGAVMALADGVNWGAKPRMAARCAVLGFMRHLHRSLGRACSGSAGCNGAAASNTSASARAAPQYVDSSAMFKELVGAIPGAQQLILKQMGTLTTLVASVVLPLYSPERSSHPQKEEQGGTSSADSAKGKEGKKAKVPEPAPRRWAALTLSIGDSAAFVYRSATSAVEEITAAAHCTGVRDVRVCPGVLGYALGEDPDLRNMVVCLTFLDEGDYVFLASDGVADNFDPVICKQARHRGAASRSQMFEAWELALPELDPPEVQQHAMQGLTGVLRRVQADHVAAQGGALSAQALAQGLVQHVYELTEQQRQVVERYNLSRANNVSSSSSFVRSSGSICITGRDTQHEELMRTLKRLPGKLDHATVVCYQAGVHG